MVGRILGLLPCLAGILAAPELQSNKSGHRAVGELLPGALHGHTRPPKCRQWCCTPVAQQPLEAGSAVLLFGVLARSTDTQHTAGC